MKWNTSKVTYYDRGKRPYFKDDEIPEAVILAMGEETVKEYIAKGYIADGKTKLDDVKEAQEEERKALHGKATLLGLKPHPKLGIDKLNAMLKDHDALETLKIEALDLGIDPSDDVTFADLQILVDEKKDEIE